LILRSEVDPEVSPVVAGCRSWLGIVTHLGVALLLSMIGEPVSTTVYDRANRTPSERSIVDTTQG
jgi:hypothetical protein